MLCNVGHLLDDIAGVEIRWENAKYLDKPKAFMFVKL